MGKTDEDLMKMQGILLERTKPEGGEITWKKNCLETSDLWKGISKNAMEPKMALDMFAKG
jgi:hypothetical protein